LEGFLFLHWILQVFSYETAHKINNICCLLLSFKDLLSAKESDKDDLAHSLMDISSNKDNNNDNYDDLNHNPFNDLSVKKQHSHNNGQEKYETIWIIKKTVFKRLNYLLSSLTFLHRWEQSIIARITDTARTAYIIRINSRIIN